MRSFSCFAAVVFLALATRGDAQGTKKQPSKASITKAMYLVTGMH